MQWDGSYVAGVSNISQEGRATGPVTHREGGDPSTARVSPSTPMFDPITLQRGVTHDAEVEGRADLIYSTDGDATISLEDFRKDVIIEQYRQHYNATRPQSGLKYRTLSEVRTEYDTTVDTGIRQPGSREMASVPL